MRIDSGLPLNLPIALAAPARAQPFGVIDESTRALDAAGAGALLARAWQAIVGGSAPPQGVRLLTAQWALETDAGRQMHGHNFGGIKAGPGAAGASFRTIEGYGVQRREVTARFRVYDSADTGARDYVRLLANRYPSALDAARTGDVPGFARALARGGYFSADPDAYARGLEQRFRALQGDVPMSSVNSPVVVGLSEGALWGLLRALDRQPEST
jgi:hypothetical protein